MTNSSLGQGREARVSVNLDIANLPPEAAATILKEAVNYGRVITARAFSDFRRNDLGDLPVQLFQLGFQLIHCPSWPNGGGRLKSVVDSILAQDLRDQAENDPSLDVFILGSGDRDFLAVVHALRRHGRKVIIASTVDASNRALLATADGYIQIQAPERHSFHVPSAQMYAPQPPAAVYSGPVTSVLAVAPPLTPVAAPPPAPAPVRHAAPHLLPPRQRHQERGMRNVGAAPMTAAPVVPAPPPVAPAPMVTSAAPAGAAARPVVTAAPPPTVHPLQPQREAAPFGRMTRQSAPVRAQATAPVAAPYVPEPQEELGLAVSATAAPASYPHLTAATLHDQIMELVLSQPQVTPRQVLQALAPRAEAGSARRRQAIGDAIAQLIQQGRLSRQTEVVRGRPADVLSVNGTSAVTASVAPLEVPLAPEEDVAVALPAVPRRETGRSRFGERRTARSSQQPAAREARPEPEVVVNDLDPFAGLPVDEVDETAVWEAAPAALGPAEATSAAIEPEAAPEREPVTEPEVQPERAAPERSTLVGRRAAAAPRTPVAAVEPVRPARRFRAPVFTHTPEVQETSTAIDEQPAPVAAEIPQSEPEAVVATPEPVVGTVLEPMATPIEVPQDEAPAESTTEAATEEAAATAAPRPRRRRTRARSANGKSETADDTGESAATDSESETVVTP